MRSTDILTYLLTYNTSHARVSTADRGTKQNVYCNIHDASDDDDDDDKQRHYTSNRCEAGDHDNHCRPNKHIFIDIYSVDHSSTKVALSFAIL